MKRGVSIIIVNESNEVLLQHRDNRPDIDYPGCWGLIGGGCQRDEHPEKAICREVKEEIGLSVNNIIYFHKYYQQNIEEYVYITSTSKNISDMKVTEGQNVSFIKFEDLKRYKIRDDDLNSLKLYMENQALNKANAADAKKPRG